MLTLHKRVRLFTRRPRIVYVGVGLTLVLAGGCPTLLGPDTASESGPVFNNTTDPANAGAAYIGSAACTACHAGTAETAALHGHVHALKPVEGVPPVYPKAAERAGVPAPPPGKDWADVSYVMGGYVHGAVFVGTDGFVLTDGVEGGNTQWNLDFPPNGTEAGFAAFGADQQSPLPYEYDCFRCHTTGPRRQDAGGGRTQDGRPGIEGTWVEAGVQCEACHGPGSLHAPNPAARDLYVGSASMTCARCHLAGDDPSVIRAAGGYISANTQYAELLASGGHACFACGVCHDPHASTIYQRSQGIRNACQACHADASMAGHSETVFVRAGYEEPITCESCHMPFTGLSNSAAGADIMGRLGRMGDVRSHIFRIAVRDADFTDMFTAGGTQVVTDSDGRAEVTVDFVCLRCHTIDATVENNAFPLTIDQARQIAGNLHQFSD